MLVEHGVRARFDRAPAMHPCPQCPFEDNQKGKLTRHKVGCDKRFRAERNQEPPHDWEPPAKIPKPAILPHQVTKNIILSCTNKVLRLIEGTISTMKYNAYFSEIPA